MVQNDQNGLESFSLARGEHICVPMMCDLSIASQCIWHNVILAILSVLLRLVFSCSVQNVALFHSNIKNKIDPNDTLSKGA